MAHQLTVLYSHPEDVEKFDRYYDETHVPLALRIPGVRSFTVSRPAPGPDGSPAPYHQVAVLTWDTEEECLAALGSPEGEAAVGDTANFAQAGMQLMLGPTTQER